MVLYWSYCDDNFALLKSSDIVHQPEAFSCKQTVFLKHKVRVMVHHHHHHRHHHPHQHHHHYHDHQCCRVGSHTTTKDSGSSKKIEEDKSDNVSGKVRALSSILSDHNSIIIIIIIDKTDNFSRKVSSEHFQIIINNTSPWLPLYDQTIGDSKNITSWRRITEDIIFLFLQN